MEISSKKTCFFETPGKSARSFAILAACGEAILLNDDMFQKDVCLKRRIREAFKTGDFSGDFSDDPSFKSQPWSSSLGDVKSNHFVYKFEGMATGNTVLFQRCDR